MATSHHRKVAGSWRAAVRAPRGSGVNRPSFPVSAVLKAIVGVTVIAGITVTVKSRLARVFDPSMSVADTSMTERPVATGESLSSAPTTRAVTTEGADEVAR